MHALIEAADAARRELRKDPLPSPKDRLATKRLAKVVGDMLHKGGLGNFEEPLWRSALRKLDQHMECSFDVFMWAGGFARNLLELTVETTLVSDKARPDEIEYIEGISNVPESQYMTMVLRICDAIVPDGY